MFVAQGLGAFGAPMSELTTLKKRVDQCVGWLPITGSNDSAASRAVTCDGWVGGSASMRTDGIRAFEKVTLLEPEDNALLFDVARTLLTTWRNTGMNSAVSSSEVNVRRIAALKLGEDTVFDSVSPTLAVQTLSSAGRVESSNVVKLAIVNGLWRILKTRDVPTTVRTEATTTLKVLANPDTHPVIDVAVLNAANAALKDLAPKLDLDIGPVTITSAPASPSTTRKPRSPYFIPIVATAATAVVAAGALAFMLYRRPADHALRGVGPLRRKAEAALRRRKAR